MTILLPTPLKPNTRLTDAIKAEYLANGWGSVFISVSPTCGTYFPSLHPKFHETATV
jgi:hypothetical protein